MSVVVKKRDGKEQEYNFAKIKEAIQKAAKEVEAEVDVESLQGKIEAKIKGEEVSVEAIHKIVEDVLMGSKYKTVARAYIEHRAKRDRERMERTVMWQSIHSIVDQSNEELLKENANLSSKTLNSQRTLMVGELSREIAKHVIPEDIYKAHEQGIIHFHDITFSPALPFSNCALVDLKGMLENGFVLGGAHIGTPKSIGVATAVTAQIISQVSSSHYGGTSVANIEQVLAPYVKTSYEKNLAAGSEWGVQDPEAYAKALTEKECQQAMQGLEYEINSLFNSHSQSPFTTISFGLGTSWEERLIQKCILQNRIDGFGVNKVTAIFPKLVFVVEEGINLKPSDPNYDIKQLALKCSSLRCYPDILSGKNNRIITGSSVPVTSMGCRSFLSVWKNENGKEVLDGRNNGGVVSLNLPRIALEADGDLETFWNLLDERSEVVHRALQVRIESLRRAYPEIAPTLYMQGAFGVRMNADGDVFELYKNGRASFSFGFIGIHETVCHLLKVDRVIFNQVAETLGQDIVKFLLNKTEKWKEEEGFGYSVYASPSEGICDRLLKIDRKKYGVVKNVTDKDYYTNSFHLDVREKVSPLEKIAFEAPYHFISKGGHISYCELSGIRHNLEALETIWDYAVEHLDYFGTNTETDKCYTCGFDGNIEITDNEHCKCPKCGETSGENLYVCRRICGYLGSLSQRPANHGKTEELKCRVYHN